MGHHMIRLKIDMPDAAIPRPLLDWMERVAPEKGPRSRTAVDGLFQTLQACGLVATIVISDPTPLVKH